VIEGVRTLRVTLTLPEKGTHDAARATFEVVSEVHEDQAIYQINRTSNVDEDDWGFRIQYDAEIYTRTDFVQSTSPAEVERVMSRVTPGAFEERVEKES
jgi:hypothetical protein